MFRELSEKWTKNTEHKRVNNDPNWGQHISTVFVSAVVKKHVHASICAIIVWTEMGEYDLLGQQSGWQREQK